MRAGSADEPIRRLLALGDNPPADAEDLDEAFDEILDAVCRVGGDDVVGAAVAAGLFSESIRIRCTWGDPAAGLAEVASRTGEGTVMAAIATGSEVAVAVRDRVDDWPAWSLRAAALGIQSSLAAPFLAHGRIVGAVVAHSRASEVVEDVAVAVRAGSGMAAILAERLEFGAQMDAAMSSRLTIGQAMGVLMERLGVNEQEAMAYLKRRSQDENIKVVRLAQRIVDDASSP